MRLLPLAGDFSFVGNRKNFLILHSEQTMINLAIFAKRRVTGILHSKIHPRVVDE